MNSLNDIANERFKVKPFDDNDIDTFNGASLKRESRTDNQNEALADYLLQRLNTSNKLPLLAVGYSGIPRDTINRHVTTALEKTKTIPVKLFMHLVSQEAAWKDYQSKKAQRKEEGGAT